MVRVKLSLPESPEEWKNLPGGQFGTEGNRLKVLPGTISCVEIEKTKGHYGPPYEVFCFRFVDDDALRRMELSIDSRSKSLVEKIEGAILAAEKSQIECIVGFRKFTRSCVPLRHVHYLQVPGVMECVVKDRQVTYFGELASKMSEFSDSEH